MKSIKWIAVFLALLVCLSGCAGTHQSGGSYNIYLIAKSSTTEFWKAVFSGANAAKSEYNVQLTILAPDTEEDFEVQNDYIRQAVADGADAIVFSAISYTENAAAIDEAVAAGVRVVVIDSDVDSDAVSCRIGTDNYDAGCKAAEAAMKDENEEIHIGIVNYDKNSDNGQKREEGFRDSILRDERAGIDAVINVLSDTENAKKRTKKMLKKHPKINVIVTFNEWTTLGVGYAIQELGLKDNVRVVAFDSNVVSVGMLETGEVDTLIVQNSYAMGYLGVETA